MSVVKEERKMSLGNDRYDKSRAMLETGLLSDCQFEVKFLEEEPQVCNLNLSLLLNHAWKFEKLLLYCNIFMDRSSKHTRTNWCMQAMFSKKCFCLLRRPKAQSL
jgi:hypothetical protein